MKLQMTIMIILMPFYILKKIYEGANIEELPTGKT